MKVSDLEASINESLLGGDPSGVDISTVKKDNLITFQAFDPKSDDDKPVGALVLSQNVISELIIKDDAKNKNSIATSLMRSVCQFADKTNQPLVIPMNGIDGIRVLRDLEFFGFIKSGNSLERRPGASLPFATNMIAP